jgi:hypothetical protein
LWIRTRVSFWVTTAMKRCRCVIVQKADMELG